MWGGIYIDLMLFDEICMRWTHYVNVRAALLKKRLLLWLFRGSSIRCYTLVDTFDIVL